MPSRQASTKTKSTINKSPYLALSDLSDLSFLSNLSKRASDKFPTIHITLDHLVEAVILLAVGITPLIFSPLTSELFEFPKMIWVYGLSIAGLVLMVIRSILKQRLDVPLTPLDKPLYAYILVFLLATLFSIDLYTSIAGYYTRFNGGLASLVAFLILGYLTIIHVADGQELNRSQKLQRIVWAWLAGATVTSVWAISEHFGRDPSCWILRGTWTADCWIQDVQARVFSTFGQPNWLATYLLTALPLGLVLVITHTNRKLSILSILATVLCYAALWYTYSRSAWFGLAAIMVTLACCIPLKLIRQRWIGLATLVCACLIISVSSLNMAASRSATSLESGSNDSSTGQLRLMIWQGSLNLIQQHPLLGTGPETFAYSFLPHRPEGMNQTTEWNFLYNKAHNEVFHTAATTGILGLITWLGLFVGLFIYSWRQGIFFNLQKLHRRFKAAAGDARHRSKHQKVAASEYGRPEKLPSLAEKNHIPAALLAGILGVFVSQLLGFSVVVTSMLFWVGLAIIIAPSVSIRNLQLQSNQRMIIFGVVALVGVLFCGYGLMRYVGAEFVATQANSSISKAEAASRGQQAVLLNPLEPNYWQQLAYQQASLAIGQQGEIQAELVLQAIESANQAETLNSKNQIVIKGLISVYQQLSMIDSKYQIEAIRLAQAALDLSPTDASAAQTLANLQLAAGQKESIDTFNRLIELRPRSESYLDRAKYWQKFGNTEQFRTDLEQAMKLEPQNEDAKNLLKEIN